MIKYTLSLFMITTLVLLGCKKAGCNDMSASNYDESADVGDASCVYEGKLMFVMSNENYSNLGLDTVFVYVNNSLLGKQSTDDLFVGTPTCESTNLMVFKKELQNVVSEVVNYRIETSDSTIIREENLNLIRGKCQLIPLY